MPSNNEKTLTKYWNEIKSCHNLDSLNTKNITGCPAKGVVVNGKCPDGQAPDRDNNCPTKEITPAGDELIWSKSRDTWYYKNGLLHLHLVQEADNGDGPSSSSPTGSCSEDPKPPSCPNARKPGDASENYYFCPAGGCSVYGVQLNDDALVKPYKPGKFKQGVSTCGVPMEGSFGSPYLLADKNGAPLKRVPKVGVPKIKSQDSAKQSNLTFPHYALAEADERTMCPVTSSSPWGATPGRGSDPQSFEVRYPANFDVSIVEELQPNTRQASYHPALNVLVVSSLEKGREYRITVSSPKEPQRCIATFIPDGTPSKPHFERKTGACIEPNGGWYIQVH